jgi:hypothetical protein
MKFELIDNDFSLEIEPLRLMFPNAQTDRDRNMISIKIIINAGGFKADYIAEIMTVDFEKFKQELKRLYDNLSGYANFDCLERYLMINIKGDGLGHFIADCEAIDKPGFEESTLRFTLHFDQTKINDLVYQLDLITKEYPITGYFKIKNQ